MGYPKEFEVIRDCLYQSPTGVIKKNRGDRVIANSKAEEPGVNFRLINETKKEKAALANNPPEGENLTIDQKRQILREKSIIGKGNHSEETIAKTYDQYFPENQKEPEKSGE